MRSCTSTTTELRARPVIGLALVCVLGATAAAAGAIGAPVRVTLDGVEGARPGMTVHAVSQAWGMRLRPSYEVRPNCGQAHLDRGGVRGYAIFMPRGRFGAVFLRKGAVTGKGVRIGSTLTELQRRYGRMTSRPDRYHHGGRHYFVRRTRSPRWELRFDVGPGKRVTQIVFGERASVRLDEGCA
jgi:hypothetical protein